MSTEAETEVDPVAALEALTSPYPTASVLTHTVEAAALTGHFAARLQNDLGDVLSNLAGLIGASHSIAATLPATNQVTQSPFTAQEIALYIETQRAALLLIYGQLHRLAGRDDALPLLLGLPADDVRRFFDDQDDSEGAALIGSERFQAARARFEDAVSFALRALIELAATGEVEASRYIAGAACLRYVAGINGIDLSPVGESLSREIAAGSLGDAPGPLGA